MRTAYDTMKSMSRNDIYKGVNAFAQRYGLNSTIANKLKNSLNIRTTKEFKEGIAKCESWLKTKVGGQPYALLIEAPSSKFFFLKRKSKSSLWLAHRVVGALGPPAVIVQYDGKRKSINPYVKAVASGARCIVHLNDAVYSGNQLHDMLMRMMYPFIDDHTNNRIRIPIFAAAAYGTNTANQKLQELTTLSRWTKIPYKVFFASILKQTPLKVNNFKQIINRNAKNIDLAPTMSIMPYKVPNYVSFGVSIRPHNKPPNNVYHGINYGTSLYKSISKAMAKKQKTYQTYKQVRPRTALKNLMQKER